MSRQTEMWQEWKYLSRLFAFWSKLWKAVVHYQPMALRMRIWWSTTLFTKLLPYLQLEGLVVSSEPHAAWILGLDMLRASEPGFCLPWLTWIPVWSLVVLTLWLTFLSPTNSIIFMTNLTFFEGGDLFRWWKASEELPNAYCFSIWIYLNVLNGVPKENVGLNKFNCMHLLRFFLFFFLDFLFNG